MGRSYDIAFVLSKEANELFDKFIAEFSTHTGDESVKLCLKNIANQKLAQDKGSEDTLYILKDEKFYPDYEHVKEFYKFLNSLDPKSFILFETNDDNFNTNVVGSRFNNKFGLTVQHRFYYNTDNCGWR